MNTATLTLKTAYLLPGLAADFDAQVTAAVADCRARSGAKGGAEPTPVRFCRRGPLTCDNTW